MDAGLTSIGFLRSTSSCGILVSAADFDLQPASPQHASATRIVHRFANSSSSTRILTTPAPHELGTPLGRRMKLIVFTLVRTGYPMISAGHPPAKHDNRCVAYGLATRIELK